MILFMPDWMSAERKNLIKRLGSEIRLVSRDDFLSSFIELSHFRAFKRVCHACCDPSDCREALSDDPMKQVILPSCLRRKSYDFNIGAKNRKLWFRDFDI
ncbi:MAG: hypothetical protein R2750_02155 [Bacteroidales bacterium]